MIAAVLAAALVASTPHDVEVFGQKIHYVEAGAGPAIVLLHGLADDASVWSETIPALAARHHVYALDQVGFGASDKPLIPYRVQTLADFLDGFCRRTGIGRATFVGNSLGGWVAAAFALAHPEKVERLVLIDSAGYWNGVSLTPEWLARLNPSTLAGMRAILDVAVYDKSMLTDAFVEQAWAEQLKHGDGYTISRLLESFERHDDDLAGRASAIKAPTLVIWGREDALLPLEAGRALAHDIAGAQLTVLDRCGHMPQVECPGPLNAALTAFLDPK